MVALTASTLQGATVYKDIAAGDVTSLTNELAASRGGNTVIIRLAAGDYDLTGVEMNTANGGSHLYLENRAIVGQGDSPWKTRLIGDGTKRILNAKNDGYNNNTNCRIENLTVTNGWTSGNGGGVAGYPHVINCVVIGNHAEGNGGGLGGYAYCKRSLLMNNTAKGNGGGSHCPNFIYDPEICGNTAKTGGGVCGNDGSFYGSVTNCDIYGNSASDSGGGVRSIKLIENCRIYENESAVYGGGAIGHMTTLGGGRIIGSTICSNKCFGASDYGYGGGAYCYVMTNCTVFANYGRHGGGVSQCNAYKCDFHDNYATGYGGGAHGGAAGGRAEKCTFGANISGTAGGGHNTYAMELVDCDVSYAGVYSGLATGCTFHDIGRKAVIDNPYVVAAVTNSDVYTGIPICTNCLFVNNRQEWYYDRNYPQSYGQVVFKGVDNAKRTAQIVNCTVVSNTVGQTFSYCRTPDSPWNVENSVFFGNVCHWGAGDLVNYDHNITNGIFFTSCAYGIAGGKFSSAGPSIWTKAGETNYKFGANGFPAKPGFLYERDPDAEHPFSIWRTSPLRGRGAVEDWMNVAYDIRGEADGGKYMRLRDGKCDIGCYQCWEKIPGFAISFR